MSRGLSNGWHSPLPAEAGLGKPLSSGLGTGVAPMATAPGRLRPGHSAGTRGVDGVGRVCVI